MRESTIHINRTNPDEVPYDIRQPIRLKNHEFKTAWRTRYLLDVANHLSRKIKDHINERWSKHLDNMNDEDDNFQPHRDNIQKKTYSNHPTHGLRGGIVFTNKEKVNSLADITEETFNLPEMNQFQNSTLFKL